MVWVSDWPPNRSTPLSLGLGQAAEPGGRAGMHLACSAAQPAQGGSSGAQVEGGIWAAFACLIKHIIPQNATLV